MSTRRSPNKQAGGRRRHTALAVVVNLLLAVSLACSLPTFGRPTPTPAALSEEAPAVSSPAATPTPLPPALVESYPPPGTEVPLSGSITLVFNQAMDRRSVEGAVTGRPTLSGRFIWQKDNILSFTPDAPFLPGSEIAISIADSARSQNGLSLLNPLTLSYKAVGYLRLTQVLPLPGSEEVNPTSAVVVSFNRPVFPIGEQISPDRSLPDEVLSIEPSTPGRASWINTSTYVFYPEPALSGGQTYTIRVNPNLLGLDGSPLAAGSLEGDAAEDGGLPLEWSFTTSVPSLVSLQIGREPFQGSVEAPLDPEFVLTFNQPMDPGSVLENFVLVDSANRPVSMHIVETASPDQIIVQPDDLLNRSAAYTATLRQGAADLSGSPADGESSVTFTTVSPLGVEFTTPLQGGTKQSYEPVIVRFSADLPEVDFRRFISLSPSITGLQATLDYDRRTLYVHGEFAPDTSYTLTVSADLADAWGARLGQPFTLNFRTLSLGPSLSIGYGFDTLFLTPTENILPAQATNLPGVSFTLGSVPLEDFMLMLGPQGYDIRQTYQPLGARFVQQSFNLPLNQSQPVQIELSPEGQNMAPGLYYLRFSPNRELSLPSLLLVSSYIQMVLKTSPTDILVWAVDLRTGAPVAGAPLSVYDEEGSLLVQGQTSEDGIFHTSVSGPDNPYAVIYAVMGQPGEDNFGLTLSTWNYGLDMGMNIPIEFMPVRQKTYLYTDRPIYRPGQVVYFRAVARDAFNGRYTLPEEDILPISLYKWDGEFVQTFHLPLSDYGTAHGEIVLPLDTTPGTYRLATGGFEEFIYFEDSVYFSVSEYRKPEIDLQVSFEQEEFLAGLPLTARVDARYYFGAPASNLPLRWTLYAAPDAFPVADYTVGPFPSRWLDAFPHRPFQTELGELVSRGQTRTNPEGILSLSLPVPLSQQDSPRSTMRYTLEVTVMDESDLPVSNRATALVHPSPFYIALRPDSWVAQAGREIGFEALVVDWNRNPAGEQPLEANFRKVTWERQEPDPADPFKLPRFLAVYEEVGSVSFRTGPEGTARLAFTPPQPGTYELEVAGEQASSSLFVWVGGAGTAVWPSLPNQRLQLTPEFDSYLPGDTAQVFVPNPFGREALALVTVERGLVMRSEVVSIDPSGSLLPVRLLQEDIPNVYLSVIVLGREMSGEPAFRFGITELVVDPLEQVLNVEIEGLPETPAGPGEMIELGLRVTGADGLPVQGEFSLAVVDQAVLALADPNTISIVDAFYGQQPLGVRTGISLAAYVGRVLSLPPGLGGGGGEEMAFLGLREEFPDTAYWNPSIVTGPDGRAAVELSLPDSLTSWQLDVRGVTPDTRTGQAVRSMMTSKELMVRPLTPRFLVAGDRLTLAAVVHNNTAQDLQAEVSLQALGFDLGDQASSVQLVSIPAGGRTRVEWGGTVRDVEQVDLIFSATSGALRDSVRPPLGRVLLPSGEQIAGGALPVLRYSSRQTFATAGVLEDAGERLELISLPQAALQNGQPEGELALELSPSLAAAVLDSLEVLERFPYESSEQVVSRLLPNLETHQALQSFDVESADLEARLERVLSSDLARLVSRQNQDGGWSWSPSSLKSAASDPYLTAYLLFGLARARDLGVAVDGQVLERAVAFLYAGLPSPQMLASTEQLDRLAFQHFALAYAGAGDIGGLTGLYDLRSQLDPWAQALLALAFDRLEPQGERSSQSRTLLSDLQSAASRSATGVHWQDRQQSLQNLTTPVFTTAVVVYALALRDPAAPILPDAVRYLMAARKANGAWISTYESAWTLMALVEYMKGTGEWGGSFDFSADLNGVQIARGQAVGTGSLPVSAISPLSDLFVDYPNALVIRRSAGPGQLYYTAALDVSLPVESAAPLNQGFSIFRGYYYPEDLLNTGSALAPVNSVQVGQSITSRLTLVVPEDAYHVYVEDFIPAGAEILNTRLKTTEIGSVVEGPVYPLDSPLANGWGWWSFNQPQIYDERILWTADYLPAGTYELVYTLTALQPGEFRVLPARAWQYYFPDVQGSSAGTILEISPRD